MFIKGLCLHLDRQWILFSRHTQLLVYFRFDMILCRVLGLCVLSQNERVNLWDFKRNLVIMKLHMMLSLKSNESQLSKQNLFISVLK